MKEINRLELMEKLPFHFKFKISSQTYLNQDILYYPYIISYFAIEKNISIESMHLILLKFGNHKALS